MADGSLKSTKPVRVGLYGNFGAGNLGNECTLQAVVERILGRRPDARLLCFCTDPQDVQTRHGIAAFPSEAIHKVGAKGLQARQPRSRITRIVRITFKRIPLELVHWVKCLRAVSRMDMLIVAGTGIVADYMCGPLSWPYDIFKLSTLSVLCRVKFVFLSVGVGPIRHPLSRWFLTRSLALAHYRSYRDGASRQYLEKIGFNTDRDFVYPDVVFGLSRDDLVTGGEAGRKRVIGLGLKDYGSNEQIEPEAFREYLDKMAGFVAWLQANDYAVRLLIGDFQYDTRVVEEFVDVLKSRDLHAHTPWLMANPALTVKELLAQVSECEVVVSARYHNLVMALIQNKPVIALVDHAKVESLVTDFGLAQYRVALEIASVDDLVNRFQQLEHDVDRLSTHIGAKLDEYRRALEAQYDIVLEEPGTADRAGARS